MVQPEYSPIDNLSDLERRNDLPWLEGTLLAAMRTWVLGRKRGVPTDGAVRTIFANLRAIEASDHLDRFMLTLSRGCTRMIEVYCTCEPTVSADEAILLDVLAMMQEQQNDAATGLLQKLVASSAAYAASGEALAIVQLLNDAGNIIGRGPDAVRRHTLGADQAMATIPIPRRLH